MPTSRYQYITGVDTQAWSTVTRATVPVQMQDLPEQRLQEYRQMISDQISEAGMAMAEPVQAPAEPTQDEVIGDIYGMIINMLDTNLVFSDRLVEVYEEWAGESRKVTFYQARTDTLLAKISPTTVRVKRESAYKDIFVEFAERTGRRLVEVDTVRLARNSNRMYSPQGQNELLT